MFCTRGSQVSLGREPQGSPSERCVVHSWEAAFGALIHLPEGTKWRTLLVSIAEQVVANAHFLSPTAPPPPKSTHHGCVILCWWVWDHLCSLALLCFWLPLRHMQWLSPTLPAYSLTCLGPSAFSFTPLLLYTRPTSQRRMAGHHAARQTQHQDTPPQHSSLNNNMQQAILSAICPYTFTELKIPKLVS